MAKKKKTTKARSPQKMTLRTKTLVQCRIRHHLKGDYTTRERIEKWLETNLGARDISFGPDWATRVGTQPGPAGFIVFTCDQKPEIDMEAFASMVTQEEEAATIRTQTADKKFDLMEARDDELNLANCTYSVDHALDEVAYPGSCQFVGEGDDGKYTGPVVTDPTWRQVAEMAEDMIRMTGDSHHVFLEGISKAREQKNEGITTLEFSMGS